MRGNWTSWPITDLKSFNAIQPTASYCATVQLYRQASAWSLRFALYPVSLQPVQAQSCSFLLWPPPRYAGPAMQQEWPRKQRIQQLGLQTHLLSCLWHTTHTSAV